MADKIRVMIVDDHHVVRQGLAALLRASDAVEVVAEAADGREAIQRWGAHAPDVTLMDLQMQPVGGVEAIQRIRAEHPNARFVVLTTYDGDEDIFRALQAGAKGYLLKGMTLDELLETVRVVHSGKSRIPGAIAEKLADRVSGQELTPRELEVLERIVAGRSNRDAANDLGISETTVKTHVNSLLSKLGVADRTHAATLAIQRGIVHLR
ncbi:response regulator [Terriglobus aquaticus]|uniref:Response regulator n=1 Tax=Terriglobus aquaticus TaxID=940139 RepID=A0ABW9KMY4_9BACT|nr:response regulator transcription factor [Terriglobus aquaticus]